MLSQIVKLARRCYKRPHIGSEILERRSPFQTTIKITNPNLIFYSFVLIGFLAASVKGIHVLRQ